MYASEESMLIVEGADFASALAAYLKMHFGFVVVRYDPDNDQFTTFLDRILYASQSPKLLILRAHLTARAARKITQAEFTEFEDAVSLAGAKLLFALADEDNPRLAGQADAYCASRLDKQTITYSQPFSYALRWIGIDEKRRSQICGPNVGPDGPELQSKFSLVRGAFTNPEGTSEKP